MQNQLSNLVFPERRDLLRQAYGHWKALDAFRQSRNRCKKYCYGDQWGDPVFAEGRWMREEQYIRLQGSEPLKNNLIRRLVRNVLGLYRQQDMAVECQARATEEETLAEVMTTVLAANQQVNRAQEINARTLEEFLISGLAVQRKSFGRRMGRTDCWTDCVPPDSFFFDRFAADFRGWDTEVLGQVHDLPLAAVLAQFANCAAEAQAIRQCYALGSYQERLAELLHDEGWESDPALFFQSGNTARCRVIELWRCERHPAVLCHDVADGHLYRVDLPFYSDAGTAVGEWPAASACYPCTDERWHYYFLTPFGDVLAQGITPYAHGRHPYVFKAYPFIDGEIHSFVADVIDQQRYTNRLITLYDWVMRSSAKGVLLVPEECIPEGSCIDDIAEQWARFNGVIAVKTRNGSQLPQQMAANAVNIGINELLQTQLEFMEDISGVAGALQGKSGAPSTSGTLYRQQTQNARLSQLDLLDTFTGFLIDGAYIDMRNIQQFYDVRRVFHIAGKKSRRVVYDPQAMGQLDFDLILRATRQQTE